MEIRQARGSREMELARDLFQQYAVELNLDLCFHRFDEELAGLPGDYAPPEGRLLLLWTEDQPSGCVALRKLDENLCEMKRLYLKPDFRGSGRGRALTLALLREAKAIGYRRMRLETSPVMDAAVGLYRSLGFRSHLANQEAADGIMRLELDLEEIPPRAASGSARQGSDAGRIARATRRILLTRRG